MKFVTDRQFGLGNRKYTLTEDFEFFGVVLPKGLTVDGSSVPKVEIMFSGAVFLLLSQWWEFPLSINMFVIVVMLLVGICESSGWFMKPAAVHDYRFQNAKTFWGWIPANWEYFILILKKISIYRQECKTPPSWGKIVFNTLMGWAIALAHLIALSLFGCIAWLQYYYKNTTQKGQTSP